MHTKAHVLTETCTGNITSSIARTRDDIRNWKMNSQGWDDTGTKSNVRYKTTMTSRMTVNATPLTRRPWPLPPPRSFELSAEEKQKKRKKESKTHIRICFVIQFDPANTTMS